MNRDLILATAFVLLLTGCRSAIPQADLAEERCPASRSACLKAFYPDLSRPDPFRVFESRLDLIADQLKAQVGRAEWVDSVDGSSLRQTSMQLQGLLKIYDGMPGGKSDLKKLERARRSLRVLENGVGNLQRAKGVLETSRKGDAPRPILAALEENVEQAKQKMLKELEEDDWLPDPPRKAREIKEMLEDYDFRRKSKDQELQVESFIELVKGFRQELAEMEPHFAPRKFNDEDLDLGLHSARRALRWVTLIVQATEGLFYYGPEKSRSQKRLKDLAWLEAEYGDSKYIKLAPAVKGALPVSRYAFLEVIRFVNEFGKVKDFGEARLDLRGALLARGLAKTAREADEISTEIMTKALGPMDVEKHSRELYREYLRRDPLKELKDSLKAAARD